MVLNNAIRKKKETPSRGLKISLISTKEIIQGRFSAYFKEVFEMLPQTQSSYACCLE